MIDAPKEAIAAAEAYESLHVPALFQQWAPLVAEAAHLRPQQRVLDIACGTGILARYCSSVVGKEGFVAGLDADDGMLAVAGQLVPAIEWRQGVAESLPYDDSSFDAVVSQFGLMFFNDRPMALREMLRVLVPGGRLSVAVWGALKDSEVYQLEVDLISRIAGEKAADALRAPFVFGNCEELHELFQNAGVESVLINTQHGRVKYPSIQSMVEADLRGWLPIMGVHLNESQIHTILAEAETTFSQFVNAKGVLEFSVPAYIVSGMKGYP